MLLTIKRIWDNIFGQMPDSQVQTPLRDAADYSEFKSLKHAADPSTVKPTTADEPVRTPSAPRAAKPEGESAAASEAAVTQEKPGEETPPRSDAETRIRKLNAENARLKAELEARQAPQPAAQTAAKVEPPAQPAAKPAEDDPKPTRKEALVKLAQQFPTETYEELLDRYDGIASEWQQRQETRKANEKQQKDQAEVWNRAVAEVRTEKPDLDEKVGNNPNLLMRPGAWRFAAAMGAQGLRALYAIGADPNECARIANMASENEQIAAVAMHYHNLSQHTPEKPQPTVRPVLVSRAPAPPRRLDGTAPSEPKEPTSYGEFKARKRHQA